MEELDPVKKKRFRLFDSQREGKGVEKSDIDPTPNLKRFFRLYKDNLNKLLSLNILMVVGCFPLIFAVLAASDVLTHSFNTPASDLYSLFRAMLVTKDSYSPADLVLIGIDGLQVADSVRTIGNYIFWGISLLTAFTFGIVNAGAAYITRNIVKGDPVFVYSDFVYAIRRNWKQALPFGILDFILCILIPADIMILMTNEGGLLNGVFLWANIIFGILYVFMRFYIYVQMVTFDLKTVKILKNSLIFALLGFKRNILAFLGIFILVFLALIFLFSAGGLLLPLGIAFPLIVLFSHSTFMGTYASYYKIKEIMIDPYQDTDGKDADCEDEALTDAE